VTTGPESSEREERPAEALRRLVHGYQLSQAIHVAATLGIADLLAEGPLTSEELAAASGAHADSLYRLLRALASVGLFREEDGRRFELTPLGDCLRSDSPEPVAGGAAYIGRPSHWQAWGALLHSVRTGTNAFRHVHGVDVWSYRAEHPAEGAIFDRAMTDGSWATDRALLEAFDFGRFGTVVDVGGGQGAFLTALLAEHPAMQGVLFDQPHVVPVARDLLKAAGLDGRCRVVGGSFFDSVPEGGDAYVLRAILHDWEDPEAATILRSCRRALPPDGALLVLERELGAPNEAPAAKFCDLNMLVMPGGRERTIEEYDELLSGAGFRLGGEPVSASGVVVIEASPS
jgi:hypothetical protein